MLIIRSPHDFSDVTISNLTGLEVYHYETLAKELKILTNGIDPGIYIVKLMVENKPVSFKISVQ
ncbi:MAG: T9SS type A sorting domain-containing protein [Bacteroidales bacterium]|nr:T9SS type A sorting domain-containing protein [Bacteroidales bacterium]